MTEDQLCQVKLDSVDKTGKKVEHYYGAKSVGDVLDDACAQARKYANVKEKFDQTCFLVLSRLSHESLYVMQYWTREVYNTRMGRQCDDALHQKALFPITAGTAVVDFSMSV